MTKFSLVIPTLNAGECWSDWIAALKMQKSQPQTVLVIDSSSDDQTVQKSRNAKFDVRVIQRAEFNHGATRQLAVSWLPETEIVIFLTQDAVLANANALKNIISIFNLSDVGAAYGRQLPRAGAGIFEKHARLFNYPGQSRINSIADVDQLGVKTAFMSNSFAAYRKEMLISVGGFPHGVIIGEDTYVAAKALLAGWRIAYCADAQVYHSHDYSPIQEFRRYFDIGVFYAREEWLLEKLGKPEGEGYRFLKSEWSYLIRFKIWRIPESFFRAILKYSGYRIGLMERIIPLCIKRRLSMQKNYWV